MEGWEKHTRRPACMPACPFGADISTKTHISKHRMTTDSVGYGVIRIHTDAYSQIYSETLRQKSFDGSNRDKEQIIAQGKNDEQ